MTPLGPSGADLGDRLAAASASFTQASKHLNQRANPVFLATAAQVDRLVEQCLDGFVLDQSTRTASLGRNRIEKLKHALETLRAGIPATTAKHLRRAFAWTFPQAPTEIGDNDRAALFKGGQTLPWMVDDVIREMVAGAGRLASSAGYEIEPASKWDLDPDGIVRRYLGPFEVSAQLTIALRSYSDARLRYFRALRIVRRLEAEQNVRNAMLGAEAERESMVGPARWLWTTPDPKG